MPKLLALLLLLASGQLVHAEENAEWIDGSYIFFFNLQGEEAAAAETVTTSALNSFIESTVNDILPAEATVKFVFELGSVRGFVVNNIEERHFKQLLEAALPLGGQGIRNYVVSLIRPVEGNASATFATSNERVTTEVASGGCLPHPIYSGMHGLDWLDLNIGSATYCGPAFSDDKLDFFVLDTGVQPDHIGFSHTTVDVDDCDDSFSVPWTPNVDVSGHGTHVAGIAGSFMFGVTPRLFFHSIKVLSDLGSGSTTGILCALNKVGDWLDANPTKRAIINLSVGFSSSVSSLNTFMTSFINFYQNQLVVVVAAGNSNINACLRTFPVIPQVVAVGSLAIGLQKSSFSNFGSCVDIFASGENILSTYHNDGYAQLSGTSMSSPLVAGVIAQYWLDNPSVTGLQIRQLITNAPPSPLYADGLLVGSFPVGSPNKLIKYTCGDGCPVPGPCASNDCSGNGLCFPLSQGHYCLCEFEFGGNDCESVINQCISMPCINGGCCTHSATGYTCTCPQFTTGTRCETPICSFLGNLPNANLCKRFYCCREDKKLDLQCRKRNGIQYLFDITSKSCKPPSEANTVPGCV